MPTALVLRAAGTNCDEEVCRGFSRAGATPRLAHLDEVIRSPAMIHDADLIAFPGGFSYGDDIASGRIFAMRVRERLYHALREAAQRGCPMIGICNGFQVLVQVGLLPGPQSADHDWPTDHAPERRVALTRNKDARYACRWVRVEYVDDSPCVWTRGLSNLHGHESILPVGHGEGRLVGLTDRTAEDLEKNRQVAVRYLDNFNGSQHAIAGLCDPSGRIFGLMPHPDRFLDWTRHPFWTRLDESARSGLTPGQRFFLNAVDAIKEPHEAPLAAGR